jgi:hypothetical protein
MDRSSCRNKAVTHGNKDESRSTLVRPTVVRNSGGASAVPIRRQGTDRGASIATDQRADQWVEPGNRAKHGTTARARPSALARSAARLALNGSVKLVELVLGVVEILAAEQAELVLRMQVL